MNGNQEFNVPELSTSWGEPVFPWQYNQNYMPAVQKLDDIISNLERLIWEREYLKHRNEEVIDRVIRSPDYKDPLAERKNILLAMRNEFASFLGIKARNPHDISWDALGYS